MKQLWVKKHSPKDFGEYCFSSKSARSSIQQLLESGDIPHLLLTGSPGVGKSLCAHLLIEHNDIDPADVLTIDASLDNNVDMVRDRIRNFVTTTGFGDAKVVLLEEADMLSDAAQNTLREMMVRYSDDCRFILTANYTNKIVDAIKSRVQTYHIESLPFSGMVKRACEILIAEDVKFDLLDVEAIVSDHTPDLRKVINTLQQHSINGKLVYKPQTSSGKLIDLFKAGDWAGLQQFVITEVPASGIAPLYGVMFDNVTECQALIVDESVLDSAIVLLAKYQYQHAHSADPHLCICALIAEFRQLLKSHN